MKIFRHGEPIEGFEIADFESEASDLYVNWGPKLALPIAASNRPEPDLEQWIEYDADGAVVR
jgi:hypothetical protein